MIKRIEMALAFALSLAAFAVADQYPLPPPDGGGGNIVLN